jgi:hypothetical protein
MPPTASPDPHGGFKLLLSASKTSIEFDPMDPFMKIYAYDPFNSIKIPTQSIR